MLLSDALERKTVKYFVKKKGKYANLSKGYARQTADQSLDSSFNLTKLFGRCKDKKVAKRNVLTVVLFSRSSLQFTKT